jgi:hypothetical protein
VIFTVLGRVEESESTVYVIEVTTPKWGRAGGKARKPTSRFDHRRTMA